MLLKLKSAWKNQPAGATIDVADPGDADLLVKAGVAEALQGNPIGEMVAAAMAKSLEGIQGQLNQTVDEAIKKFAEAAQKSRKNAVPAIFGPGGEGDPKKTFGAFLKAIRTGDRKALDEMGSAYVEWNSGQKAALNTNVGTQGGYLVPTQHYGAIIARATERSIVRRRAMVIPMAGRTVEVPTLDHTAAPAAGDTAFLGGLVGRWTEEAATLNQGEPLFKQLELTNHELSGYSKISNTLTQDAPGLEAFLFELFGKATAWYEDYAFLRGDGVKKPLGPVLWTGLISVTRSAANAYALADYAGQVARWLGSYDPDTCCFACHPTVLARLIQMNASGTGSPAIFIPNGDVTRRVKWMLGGLPVEVTEKLPALNVAGDILLGDWSQYLIGDRQQIEIAFSEHAGFITNQTFWRFVTRVGGLPWLRDKVTLSDGTNTLSPFVALAAG